MYDSEESEENDPLELRELMWRIIILMFRGEWN